MNINPIFLTDSYKLSHIKFTSPGVEQIYSNFTPRFINYMQQRFNTFDGGIVCFGLQAALQKIIIEYWQVNFFDRNKSEVITEAKRILFPYIGMEDFSHFEQLHDLGYLPIHIKALPEGSVITAGIPCFTITNTHLDFQWLPNYLESVLSAEVWKPMTTATIGRTFKKLVAKHALETTGSESNADFQLHDFSFRGQSGIESGAASGAGFLLSTLGTDNVPSIAFMEHYYDANIETDNIAYSVPASEHSVTTLGIQTEASKLRELYPNLSETEVLLQAEIEYVKYVIKQFPTGIVSYVSDSYDYFKFLDEALPILKDLILARDGKFVVRGDSGNPVDIIAGIEILDYSNEPSVETAAAKAFSNSFNFTSAKQHKVSYYKNTFKFHGQIYRVVYTIEYDKHDNVNNYFMSSLNEYTLTTEEKGTIEVLYDIFGGTVNDLGFIELNEHIGMIYGDGINEERTIETIKRLRAKGFASTSVVLGVGSYTLNMLSRDDLGTAVKATSASVNGHQQPIYKDPKTDSSKKSARGYLRVDKDDTGKFILRDNVSSTEETGGELTTVFKDGEFFNRISYNQVITNMR